MDNLISRILWQAKNRWELVLAAVGFFIGLSLFLFCFQVYTDIDIIFNTRMNLQKQLDYLIISKKIDTANITTGDNAGFTQAEQDALKAQPFTRDLGVILSNAFEANAGLQLLGKGFVTELFFESVEDRFLDTVPENWHWQEGDRLLPVMISRDFLMLYNFGFSQARGFPFIAEDMLKLVPMQVEIAGNNKTQKFNAKIVGLSDRVASILVPYSFMNWANAGYGNITANNPLRLILSVEDRSDPAIVRFIEGHNYETSKEKLRLSDAGFTIKIVLSLIAVIGLMLIILSFIIFITTFRLVVSRSQNEIRLLIHLGYTPQYLVSKLMRVLTIAFCIVIVASAVVLITGITAFHTFLAANGIAKLLPFQLAVPAIGVLLCGLAFLFNYIAIAGTVHKST